MKGYIGEARKNAGKREAAVLLVLAVIGLVFIFGSWHANKIKATTLEEKHYTEKIQKEKYDPKLKGASKQNDKEKKVTSKVSSKRVSEKQKKTKEKAADAVPVHKKTATGQNQAKTVYLTFDDGPSRVSNGIMDVLKKYQVKATFFMLEPNMLQFQDQVKRMNREGHSLGLHGVSHDAKKIYRSKKTVVREMDQANQALQKITGKRTALIRTPYGSAPYMKPDYQKAVKDKGYELWDWTIDSMDWSYRSPQYVKNSISQLKKMEHRTEPIVILMHERKETLENLPQLLDYLKKNGYTMKRIEKNMKPVTFRVSKAAS
ncbi:Peptidoglycan/xylan/chitin deacetylase, PgdA/CDA1 family [Fictibacillus solisalsi]|uniref:Peptidoglycan/xylan/chitin deacetylase, PgdA/CDA1 family n=1 Tax=Fictibacillus solisalsi TaxID=459525 RepID=A0A1G9XBF6_9BACL|nr:polysaccharide deacetylase family protein [Fictibacillus solisalsi]SDM94132.1 Peptidoglycan/xylan/chitin deacetylase, PgdA/CDA1 family [Fictibacillus solisalsi]